MTRKTVDKHKHKHYFKSDGNGGFNISKSITAGTILLLLIFLGQAVYSFGVNCNKIENLDEEMLINSEEHKEIKVSMYECGEEMAVMSEKIHNIDSNIEEIKDLLKVKN